MLNQKLSLFVLMALPFFVALPNAHADETITCTAELLIAADQPGGGIIPVTVKVDGQGKATLQLKNEPATNVLEVTDIKMTGAQIEEYSKCDPYSEKADECKAAALGGPKSFFEQGPAGALALFKSYTTEIPPGETAPSDEFKSKVLGFDIQKIARARMFQIVSEQDSQFGGGGLIEYYAADGILLGRMLQALEVSTCN
ncbi:MAG: hypothetical protein V4760_04020 [Bdellovibrionota bacterium]